MLMTNKTKNTTKQILAIPAAAAATPPKPKTAAKSAITKNTHVYQSICYLKPPYSSYAPGVPDVKEPIYGLSTSWSIELNSAIRKFYVSVKRMF